jgi:rhamnose transport system ATP-binding protein
MASTPLLAFVNVSKSFGSVRALRDVSFDLMPGEVHALLGENGAGKSTLIRIATGAHVPDQGSIAIAGRPHRSLTPAGAKAEGIACIYQQPSLFPKLTVAENLALRLETAGRSQLVDWRGRRARARELLQRVGAEFTPDTDVEQLSMPEQQLVEIAAAIGSGARIVIMDEPTASLTRREQARLFAIVKALRAEGVGIIYISHRLEEIFTLADRVTVLRDGSSTGTFSVNAIDSGKLIRFMVGRELSQLYPASLKPPAETVLQVTGLGCAGSGVHDVEFALRRGEILGLAGLVGAGRTEIARVLFGLTPATAGAIHLRGKTIRVASPQDALAQGIAYVPEDRRRHGVVVELPVAQNISLAAHRRIFRGGWLNAAVERKNADHFIGTLGIKTASAFVPTSTLSGGNQQKVAVARWLATHPSVLILDEPTQGVDVGAKSELHRLIRQLAADGLAVILISSDLPEIIGMSDRIAVVRGGTIVEILEGGADAGAVMTAALDASDERAAS